MSTAYRSARQLLRDNAFSEITPYPLLLAKAQQNLGITDATNPFQRGLANEVQISLRGDGAIGNGTKESPFDATGTRFDSIMASYYNAGLTNLNFYFGPGTFVTKGFAVLSGWNFFATSTTTFQLAVLSAPEATALGSSRIISIIGKTTNTLVNDIWIDLGGATFDLNMQNQTQTLCPSAVQLIVNGMTAKNFRVINWGTTTTAEEFVVGAFTNGSRDNIIHRKKILWQDIEFTQPAAITNVGTVSLLAPNGGQNIAINSVLSNGWFENIEVTGINAHDIAVTSSTAIDVINMGGAVKSFHGHHNRFTNITSGVARFGYYIDTGSILNCKLENDDFSNVSGCNIAVVPTNSELTSGCVISNLSINGEMMASDSAATTEFPINIAATGGNITNVEIASNRIFPRGNFSQCIGAQNISGLRIYNNTLDTQGTIVTTGSTNIKQFTNTQLDGTQTVGDAEYIQALSGHGAVAAVDLTSLVTTFSNNGTSNTTSTLASGASGQVKTLTCIAVSGFSAVITVTNLLGGTTITMGTAGNTITLRYLNAKWTPVSNIGAVIA